MPTEMLSPGVNVTIMDFSDYVASASTTAVGIIGGARKGPVGPTLITSRQQALLTYGNPSTRDFGVYALLAALDNCQAVYYDRVVPENRKAVAGDDDDKLIFRTKDFTAEYNGAKIEFAKPNWESEFITGAIDSEHPENYVGSDENIAKYGADLSEVVGDANKRKNYFDIKFTSLSGITETIDFCTLQTVERRVQEESEIFEVVINNADSPIVYGKAIIFEDGSIGCEFSESEEKNGIQFTSKTQDSTMNGWTVIFSEPTFINTIDYRLVDTNGNIIEAFNDLEAIPGDARYFESFINTNSAYVNCTYIPEEVDVDILNSIKGLSFTMSGGTNGLGNITELDIMKALDDFSNPEIIEVDFIITPGWSADNIISKAINICETRQECMYLIDPPFGLSVQQVVDWTNAAGDYSASGHMYFNSSYAAVYYPWVQVYDEFNRGYMWMPPSAYVLSQMAYSDSISEPWFAPAGINRGIMTSIVGLETSPSQGERDLLYGRSNVVNPIINFQQMGVVIWGQKTTQRRNTALNRINVRRLVNYLKKVITASTYYYIFEPNDSTTWTNWQGRINDILATICTRRGVYEYQVTINPTADDIENHRMPGTVKFKPTKSAEFIPIDFMIMPYAASFSEGGLESE